MRIREEKFYKLPVDEQQAIERALVKSTLAFVAQGFSVRLSCRKAVLDSPLAVGLGTMLLRYNVQLKEMRSKEVASMIKTGWGV